jgi:hypothetical protein
MKTSQFCYLSDDALALSEGNRTVTFSARMAKGLRGAEVDADRLAAALATYARADGHITMGEECGGHLKKETGGRFSFEVDTPNAWKLVKASVLNGLLIETDVLGFAVNRVSRVDSPSAMNKLSNGGVDMLQKNSGSPVSRAQLGNPWLRKDGSTIPYSGVTTRSNTAAGADDARMANIKRLGVLQRYLLTNPQDADTIAEVRSLVELLGGDGKIIDPVSEGAKAPHLLAGEEKAAGNWLQRKAIDDLNFRKALTKTMGRPMVMSRGY